MVCNPGMCPYWELNQWPFGLDWSALSPLSHTNQGCLFDYMKWCLIVILICTALISVAVEHIFMCLLDIYVSSLERRIYNSFAYFKLNYLPFKKKRFSLFLERGEGEEKERERNINVREKHRLVASHMRPHQGLNPQLRHVPRPRIKLVTFCFVKWHPTKWAALVRIFHFLGSIFGSTKNLNFDHVQLIYFSLCLCFWCYS